MEASGGVQPLIAEPLMTTERPPQPSRSAKLVNQIGKVWNRRGSTAQPSKSDAQATTSIPTECEASGRVYSAPLVLSMDVARSSLSASASGTPSTTGLPVTQNDSPPDTWQRGTRPRVVPGGARGGSFARRPTVPDSAQFSPPPAVDELAVGEITADVLYSMGFDAAWVNTCLDQCGGDAGLALEHLLLGSEGIDGHAPAMPSGSIASPQADAGMSRQPEPVDRHSASTASTDVSDLEPRWIGAEEEAGSEAAGREEAGRGAPAVEASVGSAEARVVAGEVEEARGTTEAEEAEEEGNPAADEGEATVDEEPDWLTEAAAVLHLAPPLAPASALTPSPPLPTPVPLDPEQPAAVCTTSEQVPSRARLAELSSSAEPRSSATSSRPLLPATGSSPTVPPASPPSLVSLVGLFERELGLTGPLLHVLDATCTMLEVPQHGSAFEKALRCWHVLGSPPLQAPTAASATAASATAASATAASATAASATVASATATPPTSHDTRVVGTPVAVPAPAIADPHMGVAVAAQTTQVVTPSAVPAHASTPQASPRVSGRPSGMAPGMRDGGRRPPPAPPPVDGDEEPITMEDVKDYLHYKFGVTNPTADDLVALGVATRREKPANPLASSAAASSAASSAARSAARRAPRATPAQAHGTAWPARRSTSSTPHTAVPPPSPALSREDTVWSCEVCTFVHEAAHNRGYLICEVCSAPKPD